MQLTVLPFSAVSVDSRKGGDDLQSLYRSAFHTWEETSKAGTKNTDSCT